MVNRFGVVGVLLLALAFAAPARGSVFPFFEPAEPLAATADEIVALDFDGDGWADVAGVLGSAGQATLVLNGEDGFADAQTVGLSGPRSGTVAVAGGDLDGDGRDELLATLGESGSLVVFRGRASGGLGAPEVYALRQPEGARATAVAVADVDGDGDRDVVAAFGDSATVLVNDGRGGLSPSAGAVAIPSPSALELVTLAGDDDPDLVVLGGYTLTVLPGASGAGFGPPVTYQLGAAGTALATADVNGDGRLDVGVTYGWLEPDAPNPGLFTGTADGGLAPVAGGARLASALVLADFDADGAIDRYIAGSPPAFAEGVGTPWAESEDSGGESALAAADFDHDGKLDVASVQAPSREMQVRYSTGPQLVPSDANTEFGEATIGSDGPMIAVPVRNEGGGIARDLAPVVEGDADDFQIDMDTCRGAVLAVDGECWIAVHFRPRTLGERAADVGVVAEDSRLVWTVTMTGTGQSAAPAQPEQPSAPAQQIFNIQFPPSPRARTRPAGTIQSAPLPALRPGAPRITRPTLAALLRTGLHFTQRFAIAARVTWTLEYRGTVLARSHRAVTAGRARVTLKLTRLGKRVLRRHRPATLALRTKGILERVSTVRLRRR